MKRSYDYLNNLLAINDTIVIACSGGPDSMFLLNLLLKIRKEKSIKIICAHVNHNLREQSQEEYEYVNQYSRKNNIIFEYLKIEKYESGNIENQARKIRYKFFEKVVNKYKAQYLMTAHHGDDLIETILMRLTRGASLDAYGGFKINTKINNYNLIRPLVFLSKQEIVQYLNRNSIKYFEDETNISDKYTRNRYRKYILPFLKKENKNVHLKYLSFSQEINDCIDYINSVVSQKKDNIFKKNTIFINNLINENIFIKKRIVENILYKIYDDNIQLINSKHKNLVLNLIHSKNSNQVLNLPMHITLIKEYDVIKVVKHVPKITEYKYILDKQVKLPNGNLILPVVEDNIYDNYHLHLDSKQIKLPLIVRNRKAGDIMAVKNLNGHKKIKDIMINAKIPKSLRNTWPIVLDSNDQILWIPGIKKSKFDKKLENCDIILKYQLKEGEINE